MHCNHVKLCVILVQGKITFPNADYIEGHFQGSLTGGINVNGTLRKGLVDKDASVFSLDDYKHDVEHRAV